MNLDITRYAIEARNGVLPSDVRIWKSITNKNISKNISADLWKAMHNAYKIGDYWMHIPNDEHRE